MYKSKMSKEEFDKKYVCKGLAVNCKTEELANEFLIEADSHGYEWCNGKSYSEINEWSQYKGDKCYVPCMGVYARSKYFKQLNYTIINFTGFAFTKSDLKSWQMVEVRDGNKYFVSLEIGIIHSMEKNNSWLRLKNFNDNLKHKYYDSFDIIKVYEFSRTCGSFRFDTSDSRFSKLIWERDEQSEKENAEKLARKKREARNHQSN